ncbi:class F sortase [Streptomyces sp. A2-16]|nr:class F sortase [Streptomyces sp. A2-16]
MHAGPPRPATGARAAATHPGRGAHAASARSGADRRAASARTGAGTHVSAPYSRAGTHTASARPGAAGHVTSAHPAAGTRAAPARPRAGGHLAAPRPRPGGTAHPHAPAARKVPGRTGPHASGAGKSPGADTGTCGAAGRSQAPSARAAGARPHPASPGVHQPPRPRPLPRSRATRLLIPYLSVDAPVMNLRLDRNRRLTAPPDDDDNLVGWYAEGPSPGQQGTAVAVGHLDTDSGPAVFAGLTELRTGRRIEVRRADGRTAVYTVDAIRTFEKDHFPNREVYGPRKRPELRLITCGGTYDRRTGYSGNVVVFAHLVQIRTPAAR